MYITVNIVFSFPFQIEAARRLWRLQHKADMRAIAQFKLTVQGRTENLDGDANIHYQSALQQSSQLHDKHMKLQIHERLTNMKQRNQQLLQIIQKKHFFSQSKRLY